MRPFLFFTIRPAAVMAAFFLGWTVVATDFHVSPGGDDALGGGSTAPLRTLQAAADRAQPGDTITVHAGVYREWVHPRRGGDSDSRRIVYQAAPGERVEITGSEIVTNWLSVGGGVWKVTVPNAWFGGFNPYADVIHGDWFDPRGRLHHTGAVYLRGEWLAEAATLDEVSRPVGTGGTLLWFGEVDSSQTSIRAQFGALDPNVERVEINVRRTVFYPEKPGINYITVRGFTMRNAATPWAPPTAEQVGLIGTHWSRGWIIEDNVISHSVCSGIALGKYGDAWDNTSADTAEGYVRTIERALTNGWDVATIGHHVVRNNEISHCEQAGIVGSLGAAFSIVSGNRIHDIHVRRLFSGAEMAGIKFHAAIDAVICSNHVYRTVRGLWLDWMAQGTRVSGNLFHDNAAEDLFVEVNHGPFIVDNNLFLSATSLLDMSEGGAYAHNWFGGRIVSRPEPNRATPFHPAHSTRVAGLRTIRGGDDRFFNNIFVGAPQQANSTGGGDREAGFGLCVYDGRGMPLQTGGNVYLMGAHPYVREASPLTRPERDPKVRLTEVDGEFRLHLGLTPEVRKAGTCRVTTSLLGLATVPGLPYENPDGTAIRIGTDYLGRERDETRPTPGPFEEVFAGDRVLTVWR